MTYGTHRTRSRILERGTFWIFRLATYFILAAATYIFLDIGIKGGRTVFTTTAPFINLPFLTEPPQTLYVFDHEGKKMTLSDRQFRQWKVEHPGIEVEANSIAYSAGGIWPCIVGTALLVIGENPAQSDADGNFQVEVGGPVGGADDQHVGGGRLGLGLKALDEVLILGLAGIDQLGRDARIERYLRLIEIVLLGGRAGILRIGAAALD